jgi:hypothetical protein
LTFSLDATPRRSLSDAAIILPFCSPPFFFFFFLPFFPNAHATPPLPLIRFQPPLPFAAACSGADAS